MSPNEEELDSRFDKENTTAIEISTNKTVKQTPADLSDEYLFNAHFRWQSDEDEYLTEEK